MKKKIVILTGAGISQESGIDTFRDTKDGLWYNYDVDDVASLDGWKRDRETVIEFRNMLAEKLSTYKPNKAHLLLKKMEEKFDVTIVTQNVDDLHEKAGSSNIIHIHGELNKANSSVDRKIVYEHPGPILMGEKCEKGSQLKPNYVLFGEYPYRMEEAIKAFKEADIIIAIGTGFNIGYTIEFLSECGIGKKVYYIDKDPNWMDSFANLDIKLIIDDATTGVEKLYNILIEDL